MEECIAAKVCTGCKKPKKASLFNKHKGKRDGLQSECKQCSRNRYWKKVKRGPLLDDRVKAYKEHLSNQTPEDLAWCAGIIDGEGCVYIAKTNIGIGVANTDPRMILELKRILLGPVYLFPRSPKRKQAYRWGINGRLAGLALEKLMPYLRVKGEVAELVKVASRIGKPGRPRSYYQKHKRKKLLSSYKQVLHFRPTMDKDGKLTG